MSSPPPQPRQKKVLVVDDSATIRRQVRLALEARGYTIVEAGDGVEGWETLCTDLAIAVVICDVNMPRMDGLQLLERVAAAGMTVPIVMLTTEGQPELVKQARSFGARGWMVKPVASDHLAMVVDKLSRHAA